MANEFSIASDIKIEMLLPVSGKGIWNFSKWGGGDDWVSTAGSGFAWVDVVATVFEATVEIGATVEAGYYAPATPNTLSIRMQSATYDPFNNPYIHPGVQIKFSYRQNPTTAPTTWTVLFQGYVDTFDVSYDSEGNNIIDLAASSSLKRYLSKVIPTWTTSGSTDLLTTMPDFTTATGLVVDTHPVYVSCLYPAESYTNVLAGEVLNWYTQAEAAISYQNPVNDELEFWACYAVSTALLTPATNSMSDVHSTAATHFCISDVQFSYNQDDNYNTFKVVPNTLTSLSATKTNQDDVDLYGTQLLEQELHIKPTTTDLNLWLEAVSKRRPLRRVSGATVKGIKPEGQLANLSALLPLNTINVSLDRATYTLDEDSVITKATHVIDPTNWFVTIELWKGL